MGKYLDIAKKFEARQEEETTSQSAHCFDYREQYRTSTEEVQADCFAVDACWLIDRHPNLWMQMKNLDEVLSRLENQGAEHEYQTILERLVTTVRKIQELHKSDQRQTIEIRQ